MAKAAELSSSMDTSGPGVAGVVSAVARVVAFPFFFFVPAGTVRWLEGWLVVGVYLLWVCVMSLWLRKNDPALLKERMKASPIQEGQKTFDKLLLVLMLPAGLPLFIVPGLDFRWGWSSVPAWCEVAALVAHVPLLAMIWWVMRENTYLARVVKIDEDRGHEVITTGPYAIVRHPMYAAIIPLVLLMPLALGSYYGLIPAAAMAALLVLRTVLEDRALHRELSGYPEYAAETRHRLVPGVW